MAELLGASVDGTGVGWRVATNSQTERTRVHNGRP
jgi:hypothetical protein